MRRYVLSRVGQLVITLLIYITLVYFLLQAMPGDISMIYLQNPRIPQAARDELKKQLGLDRSPVMQYFSYMKNFFTGNLGVSFSQYPRPVWDILIERLPRTLVLFLTANSLSFYVGFVLGRVIAWKRGASIDHVATVVGITFWTAFYPLLALVLIWLFAYTLKWLPLNQFIEPSLWVHAPWPSNTVFGFMVLGVVLISVSIFIIFWRLTRGQRKTRRNIGLAWGLSAAVVAIALGNLWDVHIYHPVVGFDPAMMHPAPPCRGHVLGTDPIGRDVLAQLMFSTGREFLLGVLSAVISVVVGTFVGAIAAYYGGLTDSFFMRLADIIMLFPFVPLLVVVGSLVRLDMFSFAIILGFLEAFGGITIILKAQALQVNVRPYIDAAKVAGGDDLHIIRSHIIPNVLPLSFLYMMFNVTAAILSVRMMLSRSTQCAIAWRIG
jgi:ABC-type dipeptide/oligopeptide/nickel transport system permease component